MRLLAGLSGARHLAPARLQIHHLCLPSHVIEQQLAGVLESTRTPFTVSVTDILHGVINCNLYNYCKAEYDAHKGRLGLTVR